MRPIVGCSLLILSLLMPAGASGATIARDEFMAACEQAYPGMQFESAERCKYLLDVCPPKSFPACLEPIQRATERVARCLLEELPSVESDAAARQMIIICSADAEPHDFSLPARAKQNSWTGPASANDCIRRHSKQTASNSAVHEIVRACNYLY
jgi:hypothetical protein